VAATLGSTWTAGVSVELLGNAALTARSGSVTMDGGGTTDFQAISVDLGDNVKVTGAAITDPSGYRAISSNAAGPFVKTRGDTKNAVPRVRVQATRSGTVATIQLKISDPTLTVTEVSFKAREGNGSLDATWQTSWDIAFGTIGSSEDLTRTEAIFVTDGLDSEFLWRVVYDDENGDSKEIGGSVPVSNLEEVTKTYRLTAHSFVPQFDTDEWRRFVAYISPLTGTAVTFYATVILPPGSVITTFSSRTYRDAAADTIGLTLYATNDAGGSSSTITTLTPGVGYVTTTSSGLSESVTASKQYAVTCTLDPDTLTGLFETRLYWVEVGYTVPSYDKTI